MGYKTFTVPAKAEVIRANSDRFKAVAESLQTKHGFELQPQIDLLYVQSCLVTAGANDNDDLFLRDELWRARSTPVLKPSNWQHQDKDILGVIYSVEARDLDGNTIPFDRDETPDTDFELITEAVVFKLIHADKAEEIAKRAEAGSLFVSMEAWFDDYDYAFLTSGGAVDKVVARGNDTGFLDTHLKANRGTGVYDGQKVVRALKNITFGGQGFVDIPANKRSDIFKVANLEAAASEEAASSNDRVVDLLTRLVSHEGSEQQEKEYVLMTAEAQKNDGNPKEVIASTVNEVLDKREAAQASKQEKEALKAEAATLRDEKDTLSTQASGFEKQVEEQKKTIASVEARVNEQTEALDGLVEALAGATGDTPPEISKIDAATGVKGDGAGEAVFSAKIAWIQSSVASLIEKAAKAEELEKEIAVAVQAVRASEIRETFAGVLQDAEIEQFVTMGSAISDDSEYEAWIAEKKFFAEALKGQATTPDFKKKLDEKKKEDKKSDAAEIFAALIERRKSDGMEGFLQPGGLGIESGARGPFPDTPRFKIAGSADDADTTLENVEPQDGINLAGASNSDDSDEENPFRVLAHSVTDAPKSEEEKKADFDPAK